MNHSLNPATVVALTKLKQLLKPLPTAPALDAQLDDLLSDPTEYDPEATLSLAMMARKHNDSDRRKVVDQDTRKVIGTVATPRGVSARCMIPILALTILSALAPVAGANRVDPYREDKWFFTVEHPDGDSGSMVYDSEAECDRRRAQYVQNNPTVVVGSCQKG